MKRTPHDTTNIDVQSSEKSTPFVLVGASKTESELERSELKPVKTYGYLENTAK